MFFVFVDTQAFRNEAFAFATSAALVALRNAVNDGRITVLLTSITEREVKRLLASEVSSAFQSVKKEVRANYMLRAVPVIDLAVILETRKEDVIARAHVLWDAYRDAIRPMIVDFDNIKPSEVMDAHFANEPPFSAAKPNEFRDAFVLRALYDWAETQDQQVLVVSGDGDHASACDGHRLQHVKTIAEAIALSRDDEALQEQAREALASPLQHDIIKEMVAEAVSEIPISIEDDPDAEAEDHDVDSVEIEPDELVLVEFRDGQMIVSGTAFVTFSFHSTINDYANGSMDEGDWVYLPYYTYKIKTRIEARVAIRMPYGGAPAQPGDVNQVTIETPRDISLALDDRGVEAKVIRSWADED